MMMKLKKTNHPSIAFIMMLDLLVMPNKWLQGKGPITFNYSDKWMNNGHHQMVLFFFSFFSKCTDCIAYEQKKTMNLISKGKYQANLLRNN